MLYPGYVTFNWDGIMHTHEHHGLSHRTGDFTVGGACGVDGVLDMIAQIDKWYAGKYAKLVGLLDSIQEGDGKLLDNTGDHVAAGAVRRRRAQPQQPADRHRRRSAAAT